MDAESIYELQKIDCNCNNCNHLVRDIPKYEKWSEWKRDMFYKEFRKAKAKAIWEARKVLDPQSRKGMLRVAMKMKFQFDKRWLLNYGDCAKLSKPVCFIPDTCQMDTQKCFQHRRAPLPQALNNPLWKSHQATDEYTMDDKPEKWKIAYYPVLEDGKTKEPYEEPRALIERPIKDGIDFREVPLRYLTKC